MKQIVFTVTNDLSYDQRMYRICTSLANAGYKVLLIGRELTNSAPLQKEAFMQKRLRCFFKKKIFFYGEYNLRLFFYLLFLKTDVICAIDLDTILPCYVASALRNKLRIYDAHELFSEMKEVIRRPAVRKIWLAVEKFSVPEFKNGYTVSSSIAEEFRRRYKVNYAVIRNVPLEKELTSGRTANKIILYQGAINEARGLEPLVTAMKHVDAELHLYGNGNMYEKIAKLIRESQLSHKVIVKGSVLPAQLDALTQEAYIGINLVEPEGLNQLYSLSNKFFDYIQAAIPQVTMNFPEYKKINDLYEVAVLVATVEIKEIAEKLNMLLNDPVLYEKLKSNCMVARKVFNWQQEQSRLLDFYNNLFTH